MRLTREKIVHISHFLADYFDSDLKIKLRVDKNEIRLQIVRIITEQLRKDAALDNEIRKRITSMKSDIPEGSPEWDVLYYKFYQEALEKLHSIR